MSEDPRNEGGAPEAAAPTAVTREPGEPPPAPPPGGMPWRILAALGLAVAVWSVRGPARPSIVRVGPVTSQCWVGQNNLNVNLDRYEHKHGLVQDLSQAWPDLMRKGYAYEPLKDPGQGEDSAGNYSIVSVPPLCPQHLEAGQISCDTCLARMYGRIQCKVHGRALAPGLWSPGGEDPPKGGA